LYSADRRQETDGGILSKPWAVTVRTTVSSFP